MTQTVDQIMTGDPRCVGVDDTVADAARQMRDGDFGSVVVVRDGQVAGIVTDRDIAIRAVAEGRDPQSTPVVDVCTSNVATLAPEQPVADALQTMREHDVRRVPVVKDGRSVGILSLGDLTLQQDPESVLGDISRRPAGPVSLGDGGSGPSRAARAA